MYGGQLFGTRNSKFFGKYKKYKILLCFITLSLRAISKCKPPRVYIGRGDLTEVFLRYEFGGLLFGGAYTDT